MIEAELLLFEEAHRRGPYSYYHLLSGVDLPIKSNDYIHEFFEQNYGKEFVGFAQGKENMSDLHDKVYRYHFFMDNIKSANRLKRILSHLLHGLILKIQKIVGYKRHHRDLCFKKGSQWISITDDFCTYVLENKQLCMDTFKYTSCADEIFIQTLLWNSSFKRNIYNPDDEYAGCLREIDWQRGNPYVWKTNDYDSLISSEKLFARKFSQKEPTIIQMLIKFIKPSDNINNIL